MTAPPTAAPMAGAPTAGPGMAPPPTVAPNAGYMTPPPVAHQMTDKANGMTYEQAIGLGWTDDLLRQHGMML